MTIPQSHRLVFRIYNIYMFFLGPFINRALLMVIPGDAHFALDVNPFLPIPTEQEIEKVNGFHFTSLRIQILKLVSIAT